MSEYFITRSGGTNKKKKNPRAPIPLTQNKILRQSRNIQVVHTYNNMPNVKPPVNWLNCFWNKKWERTSASALRKSAGDK